MSMWRESYRLGVTEIDTQHMRMFTGIEDLFKILEKPEPHEVKRECEDTVLLLRDYAIAHFTLEEAYQMYIGYDGLNTHKMKHENFIVSLSRHEKNMIDSSYDTKHVKEFADFLSAWTIYHIAIEDQKIAPKKDSVETPNEHFTETLYRSLVETLASLPGTKHEERMESMSLNKHFTGDMSIRFNLSGYIKGKIVFVLSSCTAKNLLRLAAPNTDTTADKSIVDRVAGIAGTIMHNTIRNMQAKQGTLAADLSKSSLGSYHAWGQGGFYITTEAGEMQVVISLD